MMAVTKQARPEHYVLRIVFLSLMLTMLVGVGIMGQAQGDQPVFRIGVIDSPGGAINLGAQLAVSQINAVGGVIGADGSRFRLEIVNANPEDSGISGAIGNIAQASVIAVLGPGSNQDISQNLNALQSLGVPVMTPATGDTLLASDTTGLIFRARAAEVFRGRALAAYLVDDLAFANITVAQLDVDSTAGVVGFSTAASALGASVNNVLFQTGIELNSLASQVAGAAPQAVVIYGPPERSALFFAELLANGYTGRVAYNQVDAPGFRDALPLAAMDAIIAGETWAVAADDSISTDFVLAYARQFNAVPDAVAASAYDAMRLIAEAIGRPGELADNLRQLPDTQGVQGVLRPANLPRGETSNNTLVLVHNAYGGSSVAARFADGVRVDDEADLVVSTATPEPTVTPDGVIATVVSQVLNVRTGPSTNYDVLGQLRNGDQQRVLGANTSLSWLVIEFRGQQAWISAEPNLVEIFGNLNTVPVVAAPPTPTPGIPTSTPVPAIPDIVVTNVTPTEVLFNAATTVSVTVRNAGGVDAGPFAVATSFAPDNVYAAENLSGLAAGASTTFQVTMPAVAQTGVFEATIIADLNNQLNEGQAGEANNDDYIYVYRVDRASVTNVATLGTGAGIDVDGNGILDFSYVATGLTTNAPCAGSANCMGLMSPTYTFDTVHHDLITASNGINTNSVLNISLTTGATIGVLTDTGRRVVVRVDTIVPGSSVTFTYRVY